MSEWKLLSTAPRDGTIVEITAFDDSGVEYEIHPMKWDGEAENELFAPGMVGLWIAPGGEYTWREGEGGPTHWRSISVPSKLH